MLAVGRRQRPEITMVSRRGASGQRGAITSLVVHRWFPHPLVRGPHTPAAARGRIGDRAVMVRVVDGNGLRARIGAQARRLRLSYPAGARARVARAGAPGPTHATLYACQP